MQMKISLLSLMFLVMFTLKLAGVVTFSWWWVTAPLWAIPAVLWGSVVLMFVIAAIASVPSFVAGLFKR